MTQETFALYGATSGVAQSVARQLAADGVTLILIARNKEKLSAVAADLVVRGAEVNEVIADLADVESSGNLLNRVNQADHHFMFYSTLTDQEEAEKSWHVAKDSLNVNLLSPLTLLHGLANELEKRGTGSLVVVTSVAGDRGRASNYWYGTAKGALSTHCQGLRNRLAKKGVSVLTVKPGFIDTAMTAHIPKNPAVLWASADQVAALIVKGWRQNKNVIYTPSFWRIIMWVIKSIPEFIFKRLSL